MSILSNLDKIRKIIMSKRCYMILFNLGSCKSCNHSCGDPEKLRKQLHNDVVTAFLLTFRGHLILKMTIYF